MGTSQTSSSQSSNRFRESSFSSYLDGAEETFVLEIRANSKHGDAYLGRNRTAEEIDVFDAKKYFNEESADHQPKKNDPIKVFASKDQPQTATASIRSESSWNSESTMLHSVPRNQKPKETKRKSFLANIGCNCSCSDKNSVEIGDFGRDNCSIKNGNLVKTTDHLVTKSLSESEKKVNPDGHFSFPVFNSKTGYQVSNLQIQDEELDATGRRISLEVFGSPILEKDKNCLSLEKKLTMLTWDAIVPGVGEEIKIPSISSDLNNDSDSDASSDLFEIESLSKGNSFLSRQASDGLSGCITPGNCYAPSESSIEWSVVTASAADFSVFSDFEELRSTTATASTDTIPNPQIKPGLNSRSSPLKELPKRRSGILSGCKSEKAVRVAGDEHRSNCKGLLSNKRNPKKTHTFAQSKVPGFDSRKRQQSFEACVISQPQSGAAVHLLYT